MPTYWSVVGLGVATRAGRVRQHGWARDKRFSDPSAQEIARAARRARETLAHETPSLSAARPAGRIAVGLLLLLTGLAILDLFGFGMATGAWQVSLSVLGLFAFVRLLACLIPVQQTPALPTPDYVDIVPEWTILIALYKEADSVPSLLAALAKLEWDARKLDIIFACERDDTQTITVLTAMRRTYNFRIIRIPAGGPRTKPNALQTALPFARGRFITVYDAEDRPDPRQLRAAFQAFAQGAEKLAVVQAPLVAWNHDESWIAQQFALDYAIWFRVMLPFLARLSGTLPLGGTSNHFRTDIVRKVGGWDPYNVTEDADLGIRLGRRGYCAALISPPTFEEAPPRIAAWIKQRGRWIQGHIQTFSVHLRGPANLNRQLGWRGMGSFFVGLGLGPMAAIFALPVALCALSALLDAERNIYDGVVLLGALSQIFVARVAAQRDGRRALWRASLSQPFYHCLQTLAACRAMWRVVFTPSIWDKTDHGCAARQMARPHL